MVEGRKEDSAVRKEETWERRKVGSAGKKEIRERREEGGKVEKNESS